MPDPLCQCGHLLSDHASGQHRSHWFCEAGNCDCQDYVAMTETDRKHGTGIYIDGGEFSDAFSPDCITLLEYGFQNDCPLSEACCGDLTVTVPMMDGERAASGKTIHDILPVTKVLR